jgi:membrane associated rhomboid family serine protease
MKEVSIVARMPAVDVCNHCQLFWLDPGEYELIPKAAKPAAMSKAELARSQARAASLALYPAAPGSWEDIAKGLGLPIEQTATRLRRRPVITWSTAGLVTLVSCAAFFDLHRIVDRFGFIPAEAWRLGGMTVVTAFFLHGNPLHLVGNLYFLVVFGDNVEDFLGRASFAALLLVALIAGAALHTSLDVTSRVPCIGASGAISGVIAFYALRFPHARFRFSWQARFSDQWIILALTGAARRNRRDLGFNTSASAFVLTWVVLQISVLVLQTRGFVAVSGAAHVGGAIVGGLFWFTEEMLSRRRMKSPLTS